MFFILLLGLFSIVQVSCLLQFPLDGHELQFPIYVTSLFFCMVLNYSKICITYILKNLNLIINQTTINLYTLYTNIKSQEKILLYFKNLLCL
ncbi:hypothetical protein GCM10008904_29140 [Paraclostridium ghonii]